MIKKFRLILVILGFCSIRSNALEVKNKRGKEMQVVSIQDYLPMKYAFLNEMDIIAKKHKIELSNEYYWLYSFRVNKEIHINGIIDRENTSLETYILLPQKKGTILYAEGQEEIQREQILHRLLILQNFNQVPKSAFILKSYFLERLFYRKEFQTHFPERTQKSKIGLLMYEREDKSKTFFPCICYSDLPACVPYIHRLSMLKEDKYKLILQSDDRAKIDSWKGLNPFLQKLYQLYKMGINVSKKTMCVLVLPLSSPLNSQHETYKLLTHGYIRKFPYDCPFVLSQLIFKFLPGNIELDLYFRVDTRIFHLYEREDSCDINRTHTSDIVELHTTNFEEVITEVISSAQ